MEKSRQSVKDDKSILVCEECGSSAIQVLCWVDANTNEYRGERDGGIDDHWCDECQEHTRFCSKSEFIGKMDAFAREKGFAWAEDASYEKKREMYNKLRKS